MSDAGKTVNLLELLRGLESVASYEESWCPSCGRWPEDHRGRHEPDCELAAAIAQLERDQAPHVKVTEVVGNHYHGWGYHSINVGRFACGFPKDDLDWGDVVPLEAYAEGFLANGPRGCFRITVEFWPEEGSAE